MTTSTRFLSIPNSTHMWASVIWVGKRDSCYHPTSSFSENVIVAETSYQMLEVLPFCDRERASPHPPFIKLTLLP